MSSRISAYIRDVEPELPKFCRVELMNFDADAEDGWMKTYEGEWEKCPSVECPTRYKFMLYEPVNELPDEIDSDDVIWNAGIRGWYSRVHSDYLQTCPDEPLGTCFVTVVDVVDDRFETRELHGTWQEAAEYAGGPEIYYFGLTYPVKVVDGFYFEVGRDLVVNENEEIVGWMSATTGRYTPCPVEEVPPPPRVSRLRRILNRIRNMM